MLTRRFRFAPLRDLIRCTSGMAIVELAYVTPLLLVAGLGCLEVATLASARMKVTQLAFSISDNVARLGQTDNSGVTPTVTNAAVDAILDAAVEETVGVDMANEGRIIVSSLEWDEAEELPYIHWQRCKGDYDRQSAYGNEDEGNGLGGDELPPIGRGSVKYMPSLDQPIILVEVYYRHKGLLNYVLDNGDVILHEEAGLQVRDDRNLAPGLTGGATNSSCG